MDPTTAITMICLNQRCRKKFCLDGNTPVPESCCPHCGTNNIDHDEMSTNGHGAPDTKQAAKALEEITISRPRLIIKYNGRQKNFSPIYLMGNSPKECIHGGIILNETIEALREIGVLKPIKHTEIIEKYYAHYGFLANCPNCLYYEIITNQTESKDIEALDEIFVCMRFQHGEDPNSKHMTNFYNAIKKMKRKL